MKKHLIIILSVILSLCLFAFVGCQTKTVGFDQREYTVSDGQSVICQGKDITYRLSESTEGVSVGDKDGRFSVSPDIDDYTQVVLYAVKEGKVVAETIVTLRTPSVTPVVEFTNVSDYLMSGETVNAVSNPQYAVQYSLKEDYLGISVNETSGRVEFTTQVSDEYQFTIVATAKQVSVEKTFRAAVSNLITASQSVAISEYNVGTASQYVIDYGENQQAYDKGVLKVVRGNSEVPSENWSYDKDLCRLTIDEAYAKTLPMGDHQLKIITAKNQVTVTLRVASFIATAEELAAINGTIEALSGYYIMVDDIDLTDYLSVGGKGYNNGLGWNPIGVYHDVTDGTATDWAFKGTFDGNGHTISGLYMNRADELAYNSGLFGYVTNSAVIRNVGVKNAEGKANNVRSYSGGFVGVNQGTISDCWADVDVISGDISRMVGGFVGRNEGTIINCLSFGSAQAGESVGSFCGSNMAELTNGTIRNCYAVKVGSYPFTDTFDENLNKVFDTVEDMKNADFSAYSPTWEVTSGSLPILKQIPVEYGLRTLYFTNTETYYTRGDTVYLELFANPSEALINNEVSYEVVEGDKDCLNSLTGVIKTNQLQPGMNKFVIKATCLNMTAYYQFYVYEKVSEVYFNEQMEDVFRAGVNYIPDVTVLPHNANQQVQYEITEPLSGVTLKSGIIYVDNNVQDGYIVLKATAVNGVSCERTIEIKANKAFEGNYVPIYRGETTAVEFTLPQDAVSRIQKVTRYDKAIPYDKEDNTIKLDAKYFLDFETRDIPVRIITDDEIYAATVVAYERGSIIEISSVEDLLKYKEDIKTDPSLLEKTLILTNNLDFGGMTISSIGNHQEGLHFKGIFNGNGFTISNLNIDSNDFSGEYISKDDGQKKPDETLYPYHTCRYNVGLFSYVTGTITNVNFVNIKVASYFTGTYDNHVYENQVFGAYVGVTCGTLTGTVSNCTFTGCTVLGAANIGTVCGKLEGGNIVNCTITE